MTTASATTRRADYLPLCTPPPPPPACTRSVTLPPCCPGVGASSNAAEEWRDRPRQPLCIAASNDGGTRPSQVSCVAFFGRRCLDLHGAMRLRAAFVLVVPGGVNSPHARRTRWWVHIVSCALQLTRSRPSCGTHGQDGGE